MKVRITIRDLRLAEMAGVLLLIAAVGSLLSIGSYSPHDPSANVAATNAVAENWMGIPGAYFADLVLQLLGLGAFSLPIGLAISGVWTLRGKGYEHAGWIFVGMSLLMVVFCCALQMAAAPISRGLPDRWAGAIKPGGAVGQVLGELSLSVLNVGGTILALAALGAVGGLVLASVLFRPKHEGPKPSPVAVDKRARASRKAASASKEQNARRLAADKTLAEKPAMLTPPTETKQSETKGSETSEPPGPPIVPPEDRLPPSKLGGTMLGEAVGGVGPGTGSANKARKPSAGGAEPFQLPQTKLLKAPIRRHTFDEEELQATGQQIIAKFEEFGVRGQVHQINPGPVVTTFEFKPNRGVKLSKILNLSEDLCLALECESILVERIPGKPTVGIEVPNQDREIICFREVVETQVFQEAKSMLAFALGKDINGKIHCADLASMPHLLVAGQTGSGKSVMVNALIMSLLMRATPEQVRLILVDPKTVELTYYSDIPHLLTPVITDMKEATHALVNATREMERRLQLLAKHGARNIGQFNQKARAKGGRRRKAGGEEIEPLPYIVVVVDELADLMMLAGRQVEEAIQRLAQMSRAVGIHLLLATQRPSVDVITGLIKANIPARLSFLVATRVDSRTILDSMGAESLLGKGDMLFLPPGTARMRRLHGPLVTEEEIRAVVAHWTSRAAPEYQTDFLKAPESEKPSDASADDGFKDALYDQAVELVLQMGKASTSTLQRRLRLGYGRAARILDAMEREGIIGPPDGSKPRKVLKPRS
ncbi:MAG: DNA translocase FtsK [Bryobacterales bacterium]|nr:DNA translocase FtsK [Bryobacterales bacterium]